jgi:hypothetical protein
MAVSAEVSSRADLGADVWIWPEAADTESPLHVRFREAKRTRCARSEFFRA